LALLFFLGGAVYLNARELRLDCGAMPVRSTMNYIAV